MCLCKRRHRGADRPAWGVQDGTGRCPLPGCPLQRGRSGLCSERSPVRPGSARQGHTPSSPARAASRGLYPETRRPRPAPRRPGLPRQAASGPSPGFPESSACRCRCLSFVPTSSRAPRRPPGPRTCGHVLPPSLQFLPLYFPYCFFKKFLLHGFLLLKFIFH